MQACAGLVGWSAEICLDYLTTPFFWSVDGLETLSEIDRVAYRYTEYFAMMSALLPHSSRVTHEEPEDFEILTDIRNVATSTEYDDLADYASGLPDTTWI